MHGTWLACRTRHCTLAGHVCFLMLWDPSMCCGPGQPDAASPMSFGRLSCPPNGAVSTISYARCSQDHSNEACALQANSSCSVCSRWWWWRGAGALHAPPAGTLPPAAGRGLLGDGVLGLRLQRADARFSAHAAEWPTAGLALGSACSCRHARPRQMPAAAGCAYGSRDGS